MSEKSLTRSERPARSVLADLAFETRVMAELAQRLDQTLPDLIADLGPDRSPNARELQNVDRLAQHLSDTAKALDAIAGLIDQRVALETEALCKAVTLEHFKNALAGIATEQTVRVKDCGTQLF